MSDVRFYYDISCPYAYLGSTQIEAVCARHHARLEWRPMLLGGVFKAVGRQDAPSPAPKVRANGEDVMRWARHWDVPLSFPPGHPIRTVEAMRLIVAAGVRDGATWRPSDVVPALSHDLYRAYWVDNRDVSDRAVLGEIAARHGVDLAGIDSDETKEALRVLTDEAVTVGVFGAPSFLVTNAHGSFLFWGQDRLHFVEKALDGWKVPA